jgi:hypothetical protein
MVLCVVCRRDRARKGGVECRRCYKRNKQRAYRERDGDTAGRVSVFSLDEHMYEVDRKAYRDWMNNEW